MLNFISSDEIISPNKQINMIIALVKIPMSGLELQTYNESSRALVAKALPLDTKALLLADKTLADKTLAAKTLALAATVTQPLTNLDLLSATWNTFFQIIWRFLRFVSDNFDRERSNKGRNCPDHPPLSLSVSLCLPLCTPFPHRLRQVTPLQQQQQQQQQMSFKKLNLFSSKIEKWFLNRLVSLGRWTIDRSTDGWIWRRFKGEFSSTFLLFGGGGCGPDDEAFASSKC